MNSLLEMCNHHQLAYGAEFIERPRFDYMTRRCYLVGKCAFIQDATIQQAIDGLPYPNAAILGYTEEQIEFEQAVHALVRARGKGR